MSARSHGAARRIPAEPAGRAGAANRLARGRSVAFPRMRPVPSRPQLPTHSESAPTAVQLADLWDQHGGAIYALACALLGDEAAATQAVTQAMTDLGRSTDSVSTDDARRSLARYVYSRSRELAPDAPRTLGLPQAMVWLGQLAQLQRACLALCVFGGHTHRDAAGLLGVPPMTVAALLTAGLHEVGRLAAGGTPAT